MASFCPSPSSPLLEKNTQSALNKTEVDRIRSFLIQRKYTDWEIKVVLRSYHTDPEKTKAAIQFAEKES